MPTLDDFLRGQRMIVERIVAEFDDLAGENQALTAELLNASRTVGGLRTLQERLRAGAARVAGPLATYERRVREATRRVMAAAAELDEVWEEHAAAWQDLTPAELPGVREARAEWVRAADASSSAQDATRQLIASIGEYGKTGPDSDRVSRGSVQALEGLLSAVGELLAAIQKYDERWDGTIRDLEGL